MKTECEWCHRVPATDVRTDAVGGTHRMCRECVQKWDERQAEHDAMMRRVKELQDRGIIQ